MSRREDMANCEGCGTSTPDSELEKRGRLLLCETCIGEADRKAKEQKGAK